MKIFIAGANGFLGKFICQELATYSYEVISLSRYVSKNCIAIGNINENTGWTNYLKGCDVVIHLAARVHQMYENPSNSLS
jgi:UDP-glucose 4-epimerase